MKYRYTESILFHILYVYYTHTPIASLFISYPFLSKIDRNHYICEPENPINVSHLMKNQVKKYANICRTNAYIYIKNLPSSFYPRLKQQQKNDNVRLFPYSVVFSLPQTKLSFWNAGWTIGCFFSVTSYIFLYFVCFGGSMHELNSPNKPKYMLVYSY